MFFNPQVCNCRPGYTGRECEIEINECDPQPCLNGGLCTDLVNDFKCTCPDGFFGKQCTSRFDYCSSNPCINGGTCESGANEFICQCPPEYTGQKCESKLDKCTFGICQNGGACRDTENGFKCSCNFGYTGAHCEIDTNSCEYTPNLCENGGTCVNFLNQSSCKCAPGYNGPRCEFKNPCLTQSCGSGGTCIMSPNFKDYVCVCRPGFTGKNCEEDLDECTLYNNPCRGRGSCTNTYGSYRCKCESGYEGKDCESAQCSPTTCLNGGTCLKTRQSHYCACPEGFRGRNCELIEDTCANNPCKPGCNSGKNCILGYEIDPWVNCYEKHSCLKRFGDGVCNEECNSKECLFDGNDCVDSSTGKTKPPQDTDAESKCGKQCRNFCIHSYGNGFCDELCNTREFAWDGFDCEDPDKRSESAAKGVILITVDVAVKELIGKNEQSLASLLIKLSKISGTTLKVKHDDLGRREIVPVIGDDGSEWAKLALVAHNRECGEHCYKDVNELTAFLAAFEYKTHRLSNNPEAAGLSIKELKPQHTSDGEPPGKTSQSTWSYPLIAIMGLLVVAIYMFAAQNKRMKATSITWFPEDFRTTTSGQPRNVSTYAAASGDYSRGPRGGRNGRANRNVRPDGAEMRNLVIKSSSSISSTETKTDTIYEEPNDPRSWSVQHYEAYGEPNGECMKANGLMTPPLATADQARMNNIVNGGVDIIGPGGMTPLMVAAAYRGAVPYCGVANDVDAEIMDADMDSSVGASIISDLLSQGADINRTAEKTGETSLHLAARHARADHAKRLLDNGANCNAVDSTGRTPLHSAIAADARGVFELLLRHRATDLNAKSNDGTTPLILAARLECLSMLADLISADAEVNAVDDKGRTALHWAAAVNNVEAIRLLLKNGASKDAQNNLDETPLFLAAREGAPQACRLLLESGANRDITDHMDQLPRDIATKRRHADIVKILDEVKAAAVQPATQIAQQVPLSPSNVSSPKKTNGTLKGTRARKKANSTQPSSQTTTSAQIQNTSQHQAVSTTVPSTTVAQQHTVSVQSNIQCPSQQLNHQLVTQNLVNNQRVQCNQQQQQQCNQVNVQTINADHQSQLNQPSDQHVSQIKCTAKKSVPPPPPPRSTNTYDYLNSPHEAMLSPPHSFSANQSPSNVLMSPNTPMLASPPVSGNPPPPYEDVVKLHRNNYMQHNTWLQLQHNSIQPTYVTAATPLVSI